MAKAIQWSTVEGATNGHPRMHQLFAYTLWHMKRLDD